MSWTLRPGGPADAEQITATQSEGFEGYRAFAPRDWNPPDEIAALVAVHERLAGEDVWCLLAEQAGRPAGHVAFMPAALHGRQSEDTELAHLWQLFVRPPWWGSGLASALLAEAVAEARARGFTTMRLFAAAGQARARRFYEREGWTAASELFEDPDLGLPLVEYRRSLAATTNQRPS